MHSTVIILLSILLKYDFTNAENTKPIAKNNSRLDESFRKIIEGMTDKNNVDRKKLARFLTFNNDVSNIRVEAVFAVPILAIPIGGKSAESQEATLADHFPTVDVNLKSIISMAGILLMLFLVIPKFVRAFLPTPPQKFLSNLRHESAVENLDELANRVERALYLYNNIDVQSCAQKAICWALNDAQINVKRGNANVFEKLIDAIVSIPYVDYFLEDTWLWNTFQNTIRFKNKENAGSCYKFDEKCSVTRNGIHNAAVSLLTSIKNTKFFEKT